jgi:UDP-N-acetylglucosamine 2-epimerase
VLVVRETTERPEAVEAGVAKLVGTGVRDIASSVGQLLDDPDLYARMARATNPFGDGHASARIVRALEGRLFDAPCDRSEVEVSAA